MKFFTIFVIIGLNLFNNGNGQGVTQSVTPMPSTIEPHVSSTSMPHHDHNPTFKPVDFAKARDEILENVRRQYLILRNLTLDFQRSFSNETKHVQTVYKELADKVAWYFREPSENETTALDKSLNMFFPFGGDENDYLDTYQKMDEFCKIHEKYLDHLRSWLRRKYRSLVIQLAFNTVITKIEKQVDHYCNSSENKEDFVKNIKKLKAGNSKLKQAKEAILDAANYVKNSTYKVTKLGRVCCTYWDFLKQLNESESDRKVAAFAVDMAKSFFSPATNYLCVLFPYGASICQEEEKSPKVQHKYKSIILEMVLTVSEIVGAKS